MNKKIEQMEKKLFAGDTEPLNRIYDIKYPMYRLDWIKILDRAIKNRRTSWGEDPVYEWRNASDEICYAVIIAMEDAGIIPKERLVPSKPTTQSIKEEVK